MGLLELIQQKAFLGREFLTWLWFRAEGDPVIQLKGGKRCEVEFLDQLLLEASHGDARSSVLKGESPATAPEAAAALREGKKVRRGRIRFCLEGTDWITGLDAETLQFAGLQMPKVGKLPFDEALELRLESAAEFESLLADLFNLFVELRLDARLWEAELKKIQKWAAEK